LLGRGEAVKSRWKKYDRFEDEDRLADAGFMEVSRTASVLQFQTDRTGVFRTQVTKLNLRLFIRETAQPE
jgi:hypothetical protein